MAALKRPRHWRSRCRSRRTRPPSTGSRSTGMASAARRSSCWPIRRSSWPASGRSGRSFGRSIPAIAVQLEIDAKYDVYLKRQTADVDAFRRDEGLRCSADVDYAGVPGLSNEARAKLNTAQPWTVGAGGPDRRHDAGGAGYPGRLSAPRDAEAASRDWASVRVQGDCAVFRGWVMDRRWPCNRCPPRADRMQRRPHHRPICRTKRLPPRTAALSALTPVSRETDERGSTAYVDASAASGRRKTNLVAPSTLPHALDPAHLGLAAAPATSRRRPKPGWISAAAAAFPASCSPARWPRRLARRSIWSSESPRRPRSCARRSA